MVCLPCLLAACVIRSGDAGDTGVGGGDSQQIEPVETGQATPHSSPASDSIATDTDDREHTDESDVPDSRRDSDAPADSPDDSDPSDTDDARDSDTDPPDSPADSVDTDLLGESPLLETADLSDTDLPGVQPQPTCVFPTGVIAPGDDFRTIDLQGTGINAITWPYDVNDGDDTLELAVGLPATVWGSSQVFLNIPTSGMVRYELLEAARLIGTRTASSPMSPQRVRADLDDDGREDWIGTVSFGNNADCIAYDLGVGDRLTDTPDWTFITHTGFNDAFYCRAGDWNSDGISDVWITIETVAGTGGFTQYWLAGPISKGDVDVEASAYASGTWAPPDFGPGWSDSGDFNGDGRTDFFVNQLRAGYTDREEVAIFFGPLSGTMDPTAPDVIIRHSLQHLIAWSSLTLSLGDIDGDGSDDLYTSMPTVDVDGMPGAGAVYIFKGPFVSGSILDETDADSTIVWPHAWASTGIRATELDDIDGDGLPEFAVGTWARRALTPRDIDLSVVWPVATTPDTGTPGDTDDSVPHSSLPTETAIVDTAAPGGIDPLPFGHSEGAIMVFGDTPPGRIGPAEAKLLIMGPNRGDVAGGWYGISNPGDVNGDGLGDIAYGAIGAPGATIRVLFPCADFGLPPPAPSP